VHTVPSGIVQNVPLGASASVYAVHTASGDAHVSPETHVAPVGTPPAPHTPPSHVNFPQQVCFDVQDLPRRMHRQRPCPSLFFLPLLVSQ
jgi:hypothetical protein